MEHSAFIQRTSSTHSLTYTHLFPTTKASTHTLKITLHFSFVCRVICWLLSLVAHLPTPFALVFIGYLCVCVCVRVGLFGIRPGLLFVALSSSSAIRRLHCSLKCSVFNGYTFLHCHNASVIVILCLMWQSLLSVKISWCCVAFDRNVRFRCACLFYVLAACSLKQQKKNQNQNVPKSKTKAKSATTHCRVTDNKNRNCTILERRDEKKTIRKWIRPNNNTKDKWIRL